MWRYLFVAFFVFSIIIFGNQNCSYAKYHEERSIKKGADKDLVIIFHGILRSSDHMKPIETGLRSEGYEVLNVDYPSTKHTINDLVSIIHNNNLSTIDQQRRVHFIGYSMGGLVVRAILNKYRFPNLGNVLFLATPHKGSEVADFLKDNYFYKKLYGPAGQQLTTDYDLNDLLGVPYYDFAVIAGNSSIDPFSSYLIPGDDDGKVSLLSANIEGAIDSVVIKASHTFFPSNDEVLEQIKYFMLNKKFKRN